MTSATDRVGRHHTSPQGALQPALAMIALQRAEIQRLRAELAKARAPRPDTRRVRRLQSEVCRQHARAELWRHRAMRKARA